MPDFSWLPEDQSDALFTLGYADSRVYAATRMALEYTEAGPLNLEEEVSCGTTHTKVAGIKPIPEAIARIFADGLNQLRATIEHALFAEVRRTLDRALSESEGRAIEMPVADTPDKFETWLSHGRRRTIPPLQTGTVLADRLRSLQPFNDTLAHEHPLWILAQHTNQAKHRNPPAFAVLLGAVVADGYAEGVTVARESDNPLSPGDILIDAPLGVSVEFSIWPKICVQRPEDGTWHLMSRELESVETWVRTIALPTIIAGRTSVDPLPPGADTLHGYDSILDAAHSADARTASQRIRSEIEVQMLRSSAPNLLTLFPGPPSIDLPAAERWVASLSDSALLDRMSRLAIGSSNEVIDGNLPFFCRMIEEALVHRPED